MIIPVNGLDSLADYEKCKEFLHEQCRPRMCPACEKEDTFWKHGSYWRNVVDGATKTKIKIFRYICSNCNVVVSMLFSFLVPYSKFSSHLIAQAVEEYAECEISYREESSQICVLDSDDCLSPSHSQVFRWVKDFANKSELLLFLLQKEIVMHGIDRQLEDLPAQDCPNAYKAKSDLKRRLLDRVSNLLVAARLFVDCESNVLSKLHARFVSGVESLQSIFCSQLLKMPTPHSVLHLVF